MFTGIIEELGKILSITQSKITVECAPVLEGTKLGDSIAVNGVCLTVVDISSNSFVADVITPAISIITGKVNVKDLAIVVNENLSITYGNFIQAVIDFLIIAIVVFLMVKSINNVKARFEKKAEEAAAAEPAKPSNEELLLAEIRDLLKEQNK